MIVSVINPSGVLIYSGHHQNEKIDSLVALGNNKVDSIPPSDHIKSKWDGSNWSEVLQTAMEDWKADMQRTDESMPRYVEDILDGMPNKLSVAKITLDKLQAKKDLRLRNHD